MGKIIHFEKLTKLYLDTIFNWLSQDFVSEFWDNTQAHKDDIINFVEGRKTPSNYAKGNYVYWLALADDEPFAMLMTIREHAEEHRTQAKQAHISKTGHTYGIDYMIGNPDFFGKGYGSRTLIEFIDYFRTQVDPKTETFLIDPDSNNPRAKHVYMNAGFEYVGDFMMQGDCSGSGKLHHLLVKKF